MTFARQIEVVERQIADAKAKGARVLIGGARRGSGPGLFFEPTVLSGATHDMEVMREETFGPLVPVMRFWEDEEALRLANDTHLGLNATVFGPPGKAEAFARRLRSGQAIVNDVLVNYFVVESPLGGWRSSGLGVRHGVEGLRQWTRTEAITTRRPAPGVRRSLPREEARVPVRPARPLGPAARDAPPLPARTCREAAPPVLTRLPVQSTG